MRLSNSARGQALFETAIVMPLFLFALFGIFYAMKESSLSARVQGAVRYGGMVASLHEPYQSYSLYSLYATIDDVVPATTTACYSGDGSQLTAGYSPFWLPAASSALVTPCPSSLVLISGPEVYTQTVILRNDYSSISATVPVNGYISTAALHNFATTTVRASQNFFRSPEVGALLTCTTLGTAVKSGLEGENDTGAPTPLMTSIPVTLTPAAVVSGTSAACAPSTNSFAAPAAPY